MYWKVSHILTLLTTPSQPLIAAPPSRSLVQIVVSEISVDSGAEPSRCSHRVSLLLLLLLLLLLFASSMPLSIVFGDSIGQLLSLCGVRRRAYISASRSRVRQGRVFVDAAR